MASTKWVYIHDTDDNRQSNDDTLIWLVGVPPMVVCIACLAFGMDVTTSAQWGSAVGVFVLALVAVYLFLAVAYVAYILIMIPFLLFGAKPVMFPTFVVQFVGEVARSCCGCADDASRKQADDRRQMVDLFSAMQLHSRDVRP